MARQEDIPKTDPAEIEALIERVGHSDIAPRDAQLIVCLRQKGVKPD